jgi:hypothetical protein
LTLWAAVVAEWLGYGPETALTLGRFVAGSSARKGTTAECHQPEQLAWAALVAVSAPF